MNLKKLFFLTYSIYIPHVLEKTLQLIDYYNQTAIEIERKPPCLLFFLV